MYKNIHKKMQTQNTMPIAQPFAFPVSKHNKPYYFSQFCESNLHFSAKKKMLIF